MRSWKRNISQIVWGALLPLSLLPHAWATTYALSGATYDPALSFGAYTRATGITGSFTTASPLPANLNNTAIAGGTGGLGLVTSWSFNDGLFTYTPASSAIWLGEGSSFAVSTDSAGNITTFFIVLTIPRIQAVVGQDTEFLFLGFDGPGTFGANRSICTTLLAPGGPCSFYQITTDSAFSPPKIANATFSSVPCQLNRKGKCRSSRRNRP